VRVVDDWICFEEAFFAGNNTLKSVKTPIVIWKKAFCMLGIWSARNVYGTVANHLEGKF